MAENTLGFTYHLWPSNRDGRLTVEAMPEVQDVMGLEVHICGPEALRDSLTDQLRPLGVRSRDIHSEEFAFR